MKKTSLTLSVLLLFAGGVWGESTSRTISDLYCEPYGFMELPSGLPTQKEIGNAMDPHSIRIFKEIHKDSEKEFTLYKVEIDNEVKQKATLSGSVLKWVFSSLNIDDGDLRKYELDRLSGTLRETIGKWNLVGKFKCNKKEALF